LPPAATHVGVRWYAQKSEWDDEDAFNEDDELLF
jgi:hypothetical protein